MTKGEHCVDISFNPSGDKNVDEIKELVAELIDLIAAVGCDDRCTKLAQTAFEDGAMWAVKSITRQPYHHD